MTFYLDFRTADVGGPVRDPVLVIGDPTNPAATRLPVDPAQIPAIVAGRDLLLGAHGFNVSRPRGAAALGALDAYLALPSPALFIGLLWPGDCWLPVVDYPFEGDVAIDCGKRLADFCNRYCAGANSLSFLSHSLGARLVLETISRLARARVRSLCLTAGAINRDCLATGYRAASDKCDRVAVLASHEDYVLKIAFTIGDPVALLLRADHAAFTAALGYDGPPKLRPQPVAQPWQIPDGADYGHGDYLPPDTPPAVPPPNARWPRAADFMKRAFLGQPQIWPLG